MDYPIAEKIHAINGVPGRMFAIHAPQVVRGRLVYRGQKWVSESRAIQDYGTNGKMRVEICFDDECKNGHQSFAITAEIRDARGVQACGCLHDEIAEVFPELAPLIKWHLVSTDSPMHYLANALYHASDCDASGRRAGEPSAWTHGVRFGDSPITYRIKTSFWNWLQASVEFNGKTPKSNTQLIGTFRPVAIAHENRPGDTYKFAPKYTLVGFDALKWHECPFDDAQAAQEFADALNNCRVEFVKIPTAFSVGKERNLAAARDAACWPEATDEQLSAPRDELEKALAARLPGLIAEFRSTMEKSGFLWEPEQEEGK